MKNHKKSTYLILVLCIISFIIMLLVSFWANVQIEYSLRTMESNIEKRLNMAAEWLAELVSIEELDQYLNEVDMELPSYHAL